MRQLYGYVYTTRMSHCFLLNGNPGTSLTPQARAAPCFAGAVIIKGFDMFLSEVPRERNKNRGELYRSPARTRRRCCAGGAAHTAVWKIPARQSATLATAAACRRYFYSGGGGEKERANNQKPAKEDGYDMR